MSDSLNERMRAYLLDAFAEHEARAAERRRLGRPPPKKTKAPAVAAAQGPQEGTNEQNQFSRQPGTESTHRPAPLERLPYLDASGPSLRRANTGSCHGALLDFDDSKSQLIWTALDSLWFRVNPRRDFRLRRAMFGELPADEPTQTQGVEVVIVRQISPGQRARLPLLLCGDPAALDSVPDADVVLDLVWRELGSLPESGEARLLDILRKAPFYQVLASSGGAA